VLAATLPLVLYAQPRPPLSDAQLIGQRQATERRLESIAVIERKLMVAMRDGKRMSADVYRPKDESKKYPAIFVRSPYNFNFWDVRLGAPRDMTAVVEAVGRGYAYVQMNERGHFASEGAYDILGPPVTDGTDAIAWISSQPWSNGKVGTIGCSSTAEWQLAVAAQGHPGFAAMIPQGFGAGVGRVKPYYEQGNWYRGGVFQMLFAAWIYGQQNQVRPMFPLNTPREDLVAAARLFDLAPQMPPVDWSKALRHLPVMDILKAVNGPRGIFADRMEVATGGAMIQRTFAHCSWKRTLPFAAAPIRRSILATVFSSGRLRRRLGTRASGRSLACRAISSLLSLPCRCMECRPQYRGNGFGRLSEQPAVAVEAVGLAAACQSQRHRSRARRRPGFRCLPFVAAHRVVAHPRRLLEDIVVFALKEVVEPSIRKRVVVQARVAHVALVDDGVRRRGPEGAVQGRRDDRVLLRGDFRPRRPPDIVTRPGSAPSTRRTRTSARGPAR
jgi:hypothetical protein